MAKLRFRKSSWVQRPSNGSLSATVTRVPHHDGTVPFLMNNWWIAKIPKNAKPRTRVVMMVAEPQG